MDATATTPATAPPTNVDVGKRIGLSHSGVSRIRSGDRVPSILRMRVIETEYRWSLMEQLTSDERGTYAEDFEAILCRPSEPTGV